MTLPICTCDGTLRVVSLFDGIGGFPAAFGSVGVPTIATVEIDQAAAGVAAVHFPDATHFADVTKVSADDLLALGLCPVHTVFCAGWPCTDLSLAGLRLGLGGARSGLVGEVFRLLLGVQPRWFVLENVPGLLSSVCPCPGGGTCGSSCTAAHTVRGGACGRAVRGGRAVGAGRCMELHGGGMGTVLRRLVECGYGVSYRVLDAQHFGVPQRRRRVVIVGHLGDAAGPVEVLLEPAGGGRHPATRGPAGQGTAGLTAIRAGVTGGGRGRSTDHAPAGPGAGVVAPTLQGGGRRGFRIDAETAAGGGLITNALTRTAITGTDDNTAQGGHLVAMPLTAREGKGPDSGLTNGNVVGFDAAQITSGENRSNPQPGDPQPTLASTGSPSVAYALRADPGGTGQGHNVTYVPVPPEPEVWQQQGSKVQRMGTMRRGNGNVTGGVPFVAHALTAEGSDASEDGTGRGTPLVPVAFGHTQNLDPQASASVTPTMRAGSGGEGAVLAPTLTAGMGTNSGAPGNGGKDEIATVATVAGAASVRRLTPVECERLQGYPDGWTAQRVPLELVDNRWKATGEAVPQTDSPRYRQLGNSIALPVFAWVAGRIVTVGTGAREG